MQAVKARDQDREAFRIRMLTQLLSTLTAQERIEFDHAAPVLP